jgi:hypothetical protein
MPFDSSKLKIIFIAVLGMILAIWLGLSIATNQVETLIQVIAASVLIVCLFLGNRIWLLIPFMGALNIGLRLPGQPDSMLLGQILVLSFATLLLLMRKLPVRMHWTELEFWILILTLCIVQAYIRNPVGVNLFGGSSVGGKPYAIYAISVVSSLLLCSLRVPVSQLKMILPLAIVGGLMNLLIAVVGLIVPSVAFYTGGALLRSDEPNYENYGRAVDVGAAGRIGFLSEFSRNSALWISSFVSPIRACFQPFWGLMILITLTAAMFGGFRSSLITVGLTFLIGIVYHSGSRGLLGAVFGGVAGLALLAMVNLLHPLPPNVQRALTFLPGTWEERYKDDAQGSTDWRVEVWREALTQEKWIRNRWLGDGLGFRAEDLAKATTLKGTGMSGFDIHRENVLLSGDYHSTLVSTIRTSGGVGLFFLICATWRTAFRAHHLIMRHRRGPFGPLSLFVGIPLVAAPLLLLISASNFMQVVTPLLFGLSMVRLLENNIPNPTLPLPPVVGNLPIRSRVSRSSSHP